MANEKKERKKACFLVLILKTNLHHAIATRDALADLGFSLVDFVVGAHLACRIDAHVTQHGRLVLQNEGIRPQLSSMPSEFAVPRAGGFLEALGLAPP